MSVMMHENQLVLSEEDAAFLIAQRFPEYRGHVIRRLDTSGTVNAIFRVGEEAAARFPLLAHDVNGPDPTPAHEASAMEEFLQASPFPGPRPLGIAEPSVTCPAGGACRAGSRASPPRRTAMRARTASPKTSRISSPR
ncbi:hypothetical protein [Arthrobacter woluwensis]|uniref:hypothetical protein n=1 Tax=Arthrobacter woluwensis TaxID=156980 RepID=UPI0020C87E8C|nr:hypothetical protein [Arthrobacter woluwensis]